MKRPAEGWWYQPGIHDEGERVKDYIRIRPASAFERCTFSQAGPYTYYLPYVPILVCPDSPDILTEYCRINNRDIEVVSWRFDKQIIPRFAEAGLDTGTIFGIESGVAQDVLNFARGTILQDDVQQLYFRTRVQELKLVPGHVSLAASMETIVKSEVVLYSLSVQTHDSYYFLKQDVSPDRLLFCRTMENDPELKTFMKRFWRAVR